jgi:hypothetical protein
VEVIGLAELPALSLPASGSADVAALAALNGGLLVVLCSSFSDRAVGTIAAIAGQGSLALRSAELLAVYETPPVAI